MSVVFSSESAACGGAVEIRPSPADLWQRYRVTGPGDNSEEELVKKFVPLVKTVVGRLAINLPRHVQMEDLYSAGMVGLLQAIRQYNPTLGTPFEPYARVRVRGAVLDELRRMDWAPRSVHAKARKIQQAMADVETKTGGIPKDADVATALGISLEEYERWLEDIRPTSFICLDAPTAPESDDSMSEHEAISDNSQPDPLEQVSRSELRSLIMERLQQLPDLQKKVLALYYFEDLRLREIAEAFGYCESHICQIHTKAILAIKSHVLRYEARGRTGA